MVRLFRRRIRLSMNAIDFIEYQNVCSDIVSPTTLLKFAPFGYRGLGEKADC